MIKNKNLILTSFVASTLLLGSCSTASENTTTENTPVETTTQQNLDFSPFKNIVFTIKNGAETTGETFNDGDIQKNYDILNKLKSDYVIIYNVVLYENFADNTDLVVAYTDMNKMLLLTLKDGELEYITLPEEELLTQLYTLEGFDTYDLEYIPEDFADFLHDNFEKDSYASVFNLSLPQMSPEETVKWATYYEEHSAPSDYFDKNNVVKGYKFDYNNDGIEDIFLETNEGSAHYAYPYWLQGTGNENYVVTTDAILFESSTSITPISYNDINYTVQTSISDNPIIHASVCYVGVFENNKNGIAVTSVDNYLPGYKLINTWTADGYDGFDDYMLTRISTANIATTSAMGTAETNVEPVGSETQEAYNSATGKIETVELPLVDGYSVTADYNNDGTQDKITKKYSYASGGLLSWVDFASEDSTLATTLNQLECSNGPIGTKLAVFLDETEYGNILFVATGNYGIVRTLDAYKITGDTTELIGTVNLDHINLTKLSQ